MSRENDGIVYSLFVRYYSAVDSRLDKNDGKPPKAGLALFMAAAFIAAVRLARVENLSPTPKVIFTLSDSLTLARRLLDDTRRQYPELF